MDKTFILWIVVLGAIVGVAAWVGSTFSHTGMAVQEVSKTVEVLTVKDCVVEIDDDWNTCCFNACNDFCEAQGQKYTFHHPNKRQCGCWCD